MIESVKPSARSWSRRVFLQQGAIVLASAAGTRMLSGTSLAAQAADSQGGPRPVLRFGMTTDAHYADKDPAGSRFYRDSLAKMRVAVQGLNDLAGRDPVGLSFAVTLGDLVDSAATDLTDETIRREAGFLRIVETEWSSVQTERHYVLGNHCVDGLTKAEFFDHTGARQAPYSFDVPLRAAQGGVHCIVLDACFTRSGAPYGRRNFDWRDSNVPASQIAWLDADLAGSQHPVLVFIHQRLDGDGDVFVNNASAVRSVLEGSGRVLAVFQGHSHQNSLQTVGGIPYCVVRAMVEDDGAANNAFASVDVFSDYSMVLNGSYRQSSYPAFGRTGVRKVAR